MFKSIRGTKDIFQPEIFRWQRLESYIHQLMKHFNFTEIRTPVFEETSLFARGIGDETDIVGKEMYTFTDKSGASLTLKPEMTAAVVRTFIQHNLGEIRPVNKLYYIAPMFRQERPQAGRFRQFHQVGAEIFGTKSFIADGELIILADEMLRGLNVKNLELHLNSVGCPVCRSIYVEKLREYFSQFVDKLSEDSRTRLDKNPLRILDSKDEQDTLLKNDAPSILENLCDDCKSHFDGLKEFLTMNQIKFLLNPNLVRGLDYYTKTAFEFTSSDLGAQDAICGGGRYDLLVSQLGGKETPGIGWACGIERILLAAEKYEQSEETKLDCFVCTVKSDFKNSAFNIVTEIRRANIACEIDLLDRSLKAQMREANRQNAKFVIIVGEEMHGGNITLKNLSSGEQELIELKDVQKILKNKLASS
ncbi:MAG: histidine--tRNA ligase [Ignavibacteria bacterium]|nr:histidine--tRNA ligase [Ignavibacteria bacterium]